MRNVQWLRFVIPIILYFGSRSLLERIDNQATSNAPAINQEVNQEVAIAPVPPVIKNPPIAEIERLIHEKINAYRATQSLPALTIDYRITNESRQYSAKMASGAAKFSHDGFEQRVEHLTKQALKYESAGENLALLQGYDDVATVVVKGWINSPGHRKNIVGDYELTGIGVVQNQEGIYYFTQLFLKRL